MAEQENFLLPGEQLSKENLTESIADKLHHNTTYRTSSDKIQKSMQDMIETMFPKKLSNETKGFQLGDGLSITSDGVVHVGKTIGVLHYAYISMGYQNFGSESAWRLMPSTGSSYGLTEDDFQDTMKYTFFFANKETLAETLEPVEFTCRIIFGQVCFQTNANLENYLYNSTGIAGIYYFSDTTEGTYFSLKEMRKNSELIDFISFNLNCPKVDLLVVNWCAGDDPSGVSIRIRYITMNDCENGNILKMLFNGKMGSSSYETSFWGRSQDLNSNISRYIYNIVNQGCQQTDIYIDFLYWNGLWYVNDGV